MLVLLLFSYNQLLLVFTFKVLTSLMIFSQSECPWFRRISLTEDLKLSSEECWSVFSRSFHLWSASGKLTTSCRAAECCRTSGAPSSPCYRIKERELVASCSVYLEIWTSTSLKICACNHQHHYWFGITVFIFSLFQFLYLNKVLTV